MPALRPLTQAEYAAWIARAVPAYAAEKVASGNWAQSDALERARKETQTLLPLGMQTPDHWFFAIVDDAGAQVGELWFAAQARGTERVAYIYDVVVWPEHQRKGHALRAFAAAEAEVSRLGLAGIALHVFGHNAAARALYAKLGYQPTNINMFKPLARGPRFDAVAGSREVPS